MHGARQRSSSPLPQMTGSMGTAADSGSKQGLNAAGSVKVTLPPVPVSTLSPLVKPPVDNSGHGARRVEKEGSQVQKEQSEQAGKGSAASTPALAKRREATPDKSRSPSGTGQLPAGKHWGPEDSQGSAGGVTPGRPRKKDRGEQEEGSRVDRSNEAMERFASLQEDLTKLVNPAGGLRGPETVVALVALMKETKADGTKSSPDVALRRGAISRIVAVTDDRACLQKILDEGGLLVLDEWLQETHKGKPVGEAVGGIADGSGISDSGLAEDLMCVIFRALDRLPVGLEALKSCTIGKSVNQLRSHRNHDIQRKARRLVEVWKKRVDETLSEERASEVSAATAAADGSGKFPGGEGGSASKVGGHSPWHREGDPVKAGGQGHEMGQGSPPAGKLSGSGSAGKGTRVEMKEEPLGRSSGAAAAVGVGDCRDEECKNGPGPSKSAEGKLYAAEKEGRNAVKAKELNRLQDVKPEPLGLADVELHEGVEPSRKDGSNEESQPEPEPKYKKANKGAEGAEQDRMGVQSNSMTEPEKAAGLLSEGSGRVAEGADKETDTRDEDKDLQHTGKEAEEEGMTTMSAQLVSKNPSTAFDEGIGSLVAGTKEGGRGEEGRSAGEMSSKGVETGGEDRAVTELAQKRAESAGEAKKECTERVKGGAGLQEGLGLLEDEVGKSGRGGSGEGASSGGSSREGEAGKGSWPGRSLLLEKRGSSDAEEEEAGKSGSGPWEREGWKKGRQDTSQASGISGAAGRQQTGAKPKDVPPGGGPARKEGQREGLTDRGRAPNGALTPGSGPTPRDSGKSEGRVREGIFRRAGVGNVVKAVGLTESGGMKDSSGQSRASQRGGGLQAGKGGKETSAPLVRGGGSPSAQEIRGGSAKAEGATKEAGSDTGSEKREGTDQLRSSEGFDRGTGSEPSQGMDAPFGNSRLIVRLPVGSRGSLRGHAGFEGDRARLGESGRWPNDPRGSPSRLGRQGGGLRPDDWEGKGKTKEISAVIAAAGSSHGPGSEKQTMEKRTGGGARGSGGEEGGKGGADEGTKVAGAGNSKTAAGSDGGLVVTTKGRRGERGAARSGLGRSQGSEAAGKGESLQGGQTEKGPTRAGIAEGAERQAREAAEDLMSILARAAAESAEVAGKEGEDDSPGSGEVQGKIARPENLPLEDGKDGVGDKGGDSGQEPESKVGAVDMEERKEERSRREQSKEGEAHGGQAAGWKGERRQADTDGAGGDVAHTGEVQEEADGRRAASDVKSGVALWKSVAEDNGDSTDKGKEEETTTSSGLGETRHEAAGAVANRKDNREKAAVVAVVGSTGREVVEQPVSVAALQAASSAAGLAVESEKPPRKVETETGEEGRGVEVNEVKVVGVVWSLQEDEAKGGVRSGTEKRCKDDKVEGTERRGSLESNEDAMEVAMRVVREVQKEAEEGEAESSFEREPTSHGEMDEDRLGLGLGLELGSSGSGRASPPEGKRRMRERTGVQARVVGGSGSAPRDEYTYDGDSIGSDGKGEQRGGKKEAAEERGAQAESNRGRARAAENWSEHQAASGKEAEGTGEVRPKPASANGTEGLLTSGGKMKGADLRQDDDGHMGILGTEAGERAWGNEASEVRTGATSNGLGMHGGSGTGRPQQNRVQAAGVPPEGLPAACMGEAKEKDKAGRNQHGAIEKAPPAGRVAASRKRPRGGSATGTEVGPGAGSDEEECDSGRAAGSKVAGAGAEGQPEEEKLATLGPSTAASAAVQVSRLASGIGSTDEDRPAGIATASSIAAESTGDAGGAASVAPKASCVVSDVDKQQLATTSSGHSPRANKSRRMARAGVEDGVEAGTASQVPPMVLEAVAAAAVGAAMGVELAAEEGRLHAPSSARAVPGAVSRMVDRIAAIRQTAREGDGSKVAVEASGRTTSSSRGGSAHPSSRSKGAAQAAGAAAAAVATAVTAALSRGEAEEEGGGGGTGPAAGSEGGTNAAMAGGTSTGGMTPTTVSDGGTAMPDAAAQGRGPARGKGSVAASWSAARRGANGAAGSRGEAEAEGGATSTGEPLVSTGGDSASTAGRVAKEGVGGSRKRKSRQRKGTDEVSTSEVERDSQAAVEPGGRGDGEREKKRGFFDLNFGMPDEGPGFGLGSGGGAAVQGEVTSGQVALRPVAGMEGGSLGAALGLGMGLFGGGDLTASKPELGWRGLGPISAFRTPEGLAAEVRVADGEAGKGGNRASPVGQSRPSRAPLDIDLNFTDERALEDAGMTMASSHGSEPARGSQGSAPLAHNVSGSLSGVLFRRDAPVSEGPARLEFDLNRVDESEDTAQPVGLGLGLSSGRSFALGGLSRPPAQTSEQGVQSNHASSAPAPNLSLGGPSRSGPSSLPSSLKGLGSQLPAFLGGQAASSKVMRDFDLNDGPSLDEPPGPSRPAAARSNLDLPADLVQSLVARLTNHGQARSSEHNVGGEGQAGAAGAMSLGAALASARGAFGAGAGLGAGLVPGPGEASGADRGARAAAAGGGGGGGGLATPLWLNLENRALKNSAGPSGPAGASSYFAAPGGKGSNPLTPDAYGAAAAPPSALGPFPLQSSKPSAPTSTPFPAGFPFASSLSNNLASPSFGLGSISGLSSQSAAAAALLTTSFPGLTPPSNFSSGAPHGVSLKAALASAGPFAAPSSLTATASALSASPGLSAMMAMAGAPPGGMGSSLPRANGPFAGLGLGSRSALGIGLAGLGGGAPGGGLTGAGRPEFDLNSGPDLGRDAHRARELLQHHAHSSGDERRMLGIPGAGGVLGPGGGLGGGGSLGGGFGNLGASGLTASSLRGGGQATVLGGGGLVAAGGMLGMARALDLAQGGGAAGENPGGTAWLVEQMRAYQQMAAVGSKRKETEGGGSDIFGGPLKQHQPSWR